MTNNDILRMAVEAGFADAQGVVHAAYQLEAFANLVASAEREACADICDDKHHSWRWGDGLEATSGPKECAAAIRARSQS